MNGYNSNIHIHEYNVHIDCRVFLWNSIDVQWVKIAKRILVVQCMQNECDISIVTETVMNEGQIAVVCRECLQGRYLLATCYFLLFILWQLCPFNTFRIQFRFRLYSTFIALAFLHSRNIIHRDVYVLDSNTF